MAYSITLTDDEYAALSAAANRAGTTVEALVHEALTMQVLGRAPDPLAEHMRRVGHLLEPRASLAEQDELEDEAELERLANSIKPGKMVSDMVIEDREPR